MYRLLVKRYNASRIIQKFFRVIRRNKAKLEILLMAQQVNLNKMLDFLVKGIPVNNFDNGRVVKETLQLFRTGAHTGKFMLFCSSKDVAHSGKVRRLSCLSNLS